MTTPDDELFARLRASLQATAARTPIGAGGLNELTTLPAGKRSNAFVISLSAAAAVAVIGGVTAVSVSVGSGSSVQPALAGAGSSSGPGSSPNVVPNASSAPGTAAPSDPSGCVPENYNVIASAAEVAPLSYILPAVPSGYQLYGAWGVIDRQKCAGTTNWNVEYDTANGYANTDNLAIQLTVSSATAKPGAGGPPVASSAALPVPTPSSLGWTPVPDPGWTPVSVGAATGKFVGNKNGSGILVWSEGGLAFQLWAPAPGGSSSLTQLAQSLVHVSPTDPRIKPPADCQVPAGQTCSG